MTLPPMYLRDLPDGWRVALCHTSNGNPPGFVGGMSTNSTELWCRVTGPTGFDSGWTRCHSRSLMRAREWWDIVSAESDIPDAWTGTTDEPWPPPRYDAVYFHGAEWLTTL